MGKFFIILKFKITYGSDQELNPFDSIRFEAKLVRASDNSAAKDKGSILKTAI